MLHGLLPRRRWSFVCGLVVAALAIPPSAMAAPENPRGPQGVTLDALAVQVSSAENRPAVFTNKRSAFYYTQSHRNDHPEHSHFRGLNIAGRRVFSDYQLLVDGQLLEPQTAVVVVRPDALVRTYPTGIVESLRLVDQQDVVEVTVAAPARNVQLLLSGDNLVAAGAVDGVDRYIAAVNGAPPDYVAVARSGNRFLIAVASLPEAALALSTAAATNAAAWQAQRRARLESVIGGPHYLWTGDATLTATLRWIQLTTDALVTRQRGAGTVHARYERTAGGPRYTWRIEGERTRAELDIVPFATCAFPCDSGDSLIVEQQAQRLIVLHVDARGREKSRATLPISQERQDRQARLDAILTGTDFAEAGRAESHPVMRQTRTR